MASAANEPHTPIRLGSVVQASLFIRDVDRAVAFYRDVLGLPHLFTFGGMAFFDADGLRLYLHEVPDAEWKPGSNLYFLVEDIDTVYDALEAQGVHTHGRPHLIYTDEATGIQEWMAHFDDSEGNTLSLLQRIPTR